MEEEEGAPPVYRPGVGDMVWAKLGRWRYWPATVLDPGKHQTVDKAATAAAGGKVRGFHRSLRFCAARLH